MNQDLLDQLYFEARQPGNGVWKAVDVGGKIYHGYSYKYLLFCIDGGKLKVFDEIVLEKNRVKEIINEYSGRKQHVYQS